MAGRVSTRLRADSWTPAEGRRFAFTVGTAFLVLAGILWWRDRESLAAGTGALAGLLLIAGVAIPARLGPVYGIWMALAAAISKVTTPIFMGIVYFGVLTPTGLLMRSVGRNPLRQRSTRDAGYWIAREPPGRSDLHRQF